MGECETGGREGGDRTGNCEDMLKLMVCWGEPRLLERGRVGEGRGGENGDVLWSRDLGLDLWSV